MTGQGAASGPFLAPKKRLAPTWLQGRKLRKSELDADVSGRTRPVPEQPLPRMQPDGTLPWPAPAEAQRIAPYTTPLILEAPEMLPTNSELMQIASAREHARRVTQGLCWELEPDLPVFVSSKFGFGDCELPTAALWTSSQKYQFMELLGRRSAANLPSIADTLEKPLLDCELYLSLLIRGAAESRANLAEIPEAEEAGEDSIESTPVEPEDEVLGALDDKGESVLRLDNLEIHTLHSISTDGVEALVNAVKERVRTWVEGADRLGSYNHPRFEQLNEFMEEQPRKVLGYLRPDEAERSNCAPEPSTGPQLFDIERCDEPSVTSESDLDVQ